ncbi:MAG: hypothetical protein OCD02_03360 [Spirochaetaceae bacterium]
MTLEERVEAEIKNINRELEIVILLTKKLNTNLSLDDIEVRAAALSLVSIYNGIEKILVRIIKKKHTFQENSNWHTKLLNISLEMDLIKKDTYDGLKGYLAFRHFVRHAYSFEINKDAITSILKMVPSLIQKFTNDLPY